MHLSKKFFHDRVQLLLLSVNSFLALLGSVLILLRLDGGSSDSYIVQYRGNLGLDRFKTGSSLDIIAFTVFFMVVLVLHTLLGARVYHIRRHFSTVVMGMGLLLLILGIIVSNTLLELR